MLISSIKDMGRVMATITAVLSIVVGTIANRKPDLFLKIPKYGFILWTLLSGIKGPPFIDYETYRSEDGSSSTTSSSASLWLQNNDVVISTTPKSGTTWMLFCSHQIRTKGNDQKYPFGDVTYSTPTPELRQHPTHTRESQRRLYNTTILPDGTSLRDYWDHPDYPFRIFKSHFLPEYFGDLLTDGGSNNGNNKERKKNIKFVVMSRYGPDQAASLGPFLMLHSAYFRKIWGGFPGKFSGDAHTDATNILKLMMPNGIWKEAHFDFINKWWKFRNDDNVLLLHFADAKRDLKGTVLKLCHFYGVALSDTELKHVVHKCGFQYMKQHAHLFSMKLPLVPEFNGTQTIIENGDSIIRNGNNGEGRAIFSEQEKEAWRKAEEDQFGDDPIKLNWARHGSSDSQ